MRIEFEVIGQPATQGSKVPQLIRRKGGVPVLDGRNNPLVVVREHSPKTAVWRQQVAAAAREAYNGELLTCPVRLRLQFVRPRPASHFGSGRNAKRLKASAPLLPTAKPDTLKLARAVEDALTGVVWRDDSQVCQHELMKSYGPYFTVKVLIETLEDDPRSDG
ncbi:MAG: RusA family crossover junction endodeoxyribonuclease [Rhodopirellula sp.]|nr:RusA family crossover junction endodeoxyribonuclease [Rhodopirellula sp.]